MTTSALPSREIVNVIELRRNRPMVSSLKIAELFGRRHDNVLRAIRTVLIEKFSLRIHEERDLDQRGKERPVFWLEERDALTVMPFIGGQQAMEGQRKLVDAYLYYRDHFANPPRQDLLAAKRAAHHPMMDALVECREEQGKLTATHHFTNENRLCNGVVTGNFRALDEQALDNEQLNLLTQVRERNAALLVAGLDYDTRKARLVAFATRLRTRLISFGQTGGCQPS